MSGPNGEPNISTDDDVIMEINSCLDDLEERNHSLNDKLHELFGEEDKLSYLYSPQLPP
uniref:Uncharacterized protein n=1 Tax=Salmo trutta TaxID=8032 RepID=A0A673X4Y1_SALTR